jgi:MFS family permease
MDTPRRAGWPQGLIIVMVGILPMMAIVTLMPIVPALVRNFQHVAGIQTLAPLVLSAPGLCVALFSPFAGILADRIGRRRLLLVFTTLYGIGGVLPFFLSNFEALMGSRLLLGVGEAFILTLGNTLLGDYFEKDERAKWLAVQSFVGPLLGALLLAISGRLSTIQWSLPFLIYGVALMMAAFAYFTAFEPQRVVALPAGTMASGTAVMPFPTVLMSRIAMTTLVLAAVYFVYTLQFALALDVMGVKDGGAIGTYSGIAAIGVPVGAILFRFIARRSTVFQFTLVFTLLGLGMIGIGLNLGVRATVALAWIQQLGSGMTIPVLISWSLRELPVQFRGRGMGWWASAFFLGQFVSPLFVSFITRWSGGLLNTFVVAGCLCVAIAVGNAFFQRRTS